MNAFRTAPDLLGPNATPLVRKLGGMVLMSAAEIEFLEGLQINKARLDKGQVVVEDDGEYGATFVVQSGWVIREKMLLDGRRQIFSFGIPGDFLGLHINFRRVAAYSIRALTDVEVALVEPNRILEIYQNYPILVSGLSWATAREYNMLGEHAVRLGWRSALERMCHLILEMWHRLVFVGLAEDGPEAPMIEFPFNQQDTADTLGLSLVHTNRVFRELKRKGLIDYNNDFILLRDRQRLAEIAELDDTYLAPFDLLPAVTRKSA